MRFLGTQIYVDLRARRKFILFMESKGHCPVESGLKIILRHRPSVSFGFTRSLDPGHRLVPFPVPVESGCRDHGRDMKAIYRISLAQNVTICGESAMIASQQLAM